MIVALVGACLAVFMAASSQAGTLLYEGFDSYPTGSAPPSPWTDLSDAGITLEVVNSVSYAGGQSLYFGDTTSSGAAHLTRDFMPVTSLMLEYYMRSDNAAYEGHFVGLQGDSSSSYAWDPSFGAVAFGNASGGGEANYIGLIDDGGWPATQILQYETGKWYRVRRWLDLIADEETIHVDEMGGSAHGEFYRTGIKADNTVINAFNIWSSTNQSADAYLDEILVTPEPATMSLLALGLGALAIRKRKKN
jgi:PEP-CTERM motif